MKEQDSDIPAVDNLDFAWKVHEQQVAWIEKVDFKASLLLPVQFGLLTLLGAVLLSDKRPKMNTVLGVLISIGVGVIGIAIALVALAVIPRLGKSSDEKSDLIYFGHLRKLDAYAIQERISTLTDADQLSAIARQLSLLSKINWTKHQRLRSGILFTLFGALFCSLPLVFSWLFLK